MKHFDHYFINPRPYMGKKREVIKSIKNNYTAYSHKYMSVTECLPVSGVLTADLIIYHNIEVNIPKSDYNTIFVVAVNYYAMLFMDLFKGYYAVNRSHTYQQVHSLVKNVLKTKSNATAMEIDDVDEAVHSSRDISKQVVDIFYRAGAEGCKKHLAVSIYAILLNSNRYRSVNRGQIDTIIRDLYSKKLLDGSFSTI